VDRRVGRHRPGADRGAVPAAGAGQVRRPLRHPHRLRGGRRRPGRDRRDRVQPGLRGRTGHGRHGRLARPGARPAARRGLRPPRPGRGGDLPRAADAPDQRRPGRPGRAQGQGEPAQLGRQRPPGGALPRRTRSGGAPRRPGGGPVKSHARQVRDRDTAVVRRAAALLLDYPDRAFFERLPGIRAAVLELPRGGPRTGLDRFCSFAASTPELELAAHYVETFDMRRRRALHMTFYTDGDTRRRGHALARLKEVYAECGWRPGPQELPDHLSVLLEFAARGDSEWGRALLVRFQPGLELLRAGLHEHGTPYAEVVDAVAATLPDRKST